MNTEKKALRETLPYRSCVGIVVFNAAGKVWAGKRHLRRNDELTGTGKLWQLPQGGIDEGENPLAAAYRELWEETGIRSVELLGESEGWLHYDLPDELLGVALHGRYRGQRQKWFAMRFTGEADEIAINPPPDGNAVEFEDWDWLALDSLPERIVPFKREVYEAMVAQFQKFAQ